MSKQKKDIGSTTEDSDSKDKKKTGILDRLWSGKKMKNPETLAVLFLRKNNRAEPMYVVPKEDMLHIDGKTYHPRRDCIYTITKDRIPFAIIPEEGLVPKGTKEYYDIEVQRRCQEHQNSTIKAIRFAEIVKMGYDDNVKPKINPKVAIGFILAAIIGYALLKGGNIF